MPDTPWIEALRRNVVEVRGALEQSCRKANRDPAAVRLVAVTKYVGLDVIGGLLQLGLTDLGESRVQQLVQRAEKFTASAAGSPRPAPRWHMIGHLQRNKVKALLPHSNILHSLDSFRLAEEIEKHAEKPPATIDVFVEINVSGETAKEGVSPDEAEPLLAAVSKLPHVRPIGLMTMAPLNSNPETARPVFARLRELLETLRRRGAGGPALQHLSMGMSQDYAVAVEEGASFVRVGSALFHGLPAL